MDLCTLAMTSLDVKQTIESIVNCVILYWLPELSELSKLPNLYAIQIC